MVIICRWILTENNMGKLHLFVEANTQINVYLPENTEYFHYEFHLKSSHQASLLTIKRPQDWMKASVINISSFIQFKFSFQFKFESFS